MAPSSGVWEGTSDRATGGAGLPPHAGIRALQRIELFISKSFTIRKLLDYLPNATVERKDLASLFQTAASINGSESNQQDGIHNEGCIQRHGFRRRPFHGHVHRADEQADIGRQACIHGVILRESS